jgi:RNA polymerase sigma factor (sigma-70 family)
MTMSNSSVTVPLAERAALDLDAAFPALLAEHAGAVYSTALRISAQPADAEDLAAETFMRAYTSLRGYEPDRIRALRLRPWLITITLNLWRNQLRDASRRPRSVPLDGTDPPATSRTPEQHLAQLAGSEQMSCLLAALSEPQRLAVVLRYVVGLSYAEIAEVLDCPRGTAKSHGARGLTRLRAAFSTQEVSR